MQYYRVSKSTDSSGKYLSKKDIDIICSLAQKEYDRKVVQEIHKELEKLEKMESIYTSDGIKKIYDKYIPERKKLVNPVEISEEAFRQQWEEKEYKRKDMKEQVKIYRTDRGDFVRSKSEWIIANKLLKLKIPYRYEAQLILPDGGIIHPDFTVLNIRKRKEYYFEHLGMMDNPDYAEHALDRITRYERNGIFPGQQLILSHESSNRPLDPVLVENIIKQYLV